MSVRGLQSGDQLRDGGAKEEIRVWRFDGNNAVANATDNNGIVLMDGGGAGGDGGFATTTNALSVNDKWTIEVKPGRGATLNIERTLPGRLDNIMDLR